MTITDEIDCSPFDFIIMGLVIILISIGINFVIKHEKKLKNRFMYIGVVFIMFILIGAELAVVIFLGS